MADARDIAGTLPPWPVPGALAAAARAGAAAGRMAAMSVASARLPPLGRAVATAPRALRRRRVRVAKLLLLVATLRRRAVD